MTDGFLLVSTDSKLLTTYQLLFFFFLELLLPYGVVKSKPKVRSQYSIPITNYASHNEIIVQF